MTVLASSAIKHLRDVYDRYRTAPLGQLNATALELEKICVDLGWRKISTGKSFPVWAKDMLDGQP